MDAVVRQYIRGAAITVLLYFDTIALLVALYTGSYASILAILAMKTMSYVPYYIKRAVLNIYTEYLGFVLVTRFTHTNMYKSTGRHVIYGAHPHNVVPLQFIWYAQQGIACAVDPTMLSCVTPYFFKVLSASSVRRDPLVRRMRAEQQIVMSPGGADEMIEHHVPGSHLLDLRVHHGLFILALTHDVVLVPSLSMQETRCYSTYVTNWCKWLWVRWHIPFVPHVGFLHVVPGVPQCHINNRLNLYQSELGIDPRDYRSPEDMETAYKAEVERMAHTHGGMLVRWRCS